jgi:dUTP pyrophosphatase
MIVERYARVEWEEVKTLDETARGGGGFGHTGVSSMKGKS